MMDTYRIEHFGVIELAVESKSSIIPLQTVQIQRLLHAWFALHLTAVY